jgi:5,10-methylene-tetrahydrofolate dehydrogenase/methenyl tetrahydrofolate cyclohydrolase
MSDYTAELIEWQARTRDLETSNERLREERENARTLAALLEAELNEKQILVDSYIKQIKTLGAEVERLRIHIQQGVEL